MDYKQELRKLINDSKKGAELFAPFGKYLMELQSVYTTNKTNLDKMYQTLSKQNEQEFNEISDYIREAYDKDSEKDKFKLQGKSDKIKKLIIKFKNNFNYKY